MGERVHLTGEVITRLARYAVFAACLALVASGTHVFFRFIGFAPYWAVDDNIVNVSFTLADHARYGFLASPLQAGTAALRSEAFFNYGPWYFLLGGLLSWLFGHSIEIQRAIHPLGLICAGIAFLAFFKRYSVAAFGLFLLALSKLFTNHWPMIRPDIMVSVFGVLTIVSSGMAIRHGRWTWWLIAGFCAASAFVSHQIAWAMIPLVGVIWFISTINSIAGNKWRPTRAEWASLAGVVSGGILAIMFYLWMIGFRVRDIAELWLAYRKLTGSAASSYLTVLMKHLGGTGTTLFKLIVLAYSTAFIAILISLKLDRQTRTTVISVAAPSFLIGLGYLLSLGFYNNYHAGYVIWVQIAPYWTGCALLALAAHLIFVKWPKAGLTLETVACVAISALVAKEALAVVKEKPFYWDTVAKSYVNITDYNNRVMDPLPPMATAWGSLTFGAESGSRIQILQFGEGVTMAQGLATGLRNTLAPEYILLSSAEELRDYASFNLQHFADKLARPNDFIDLSSLFPNYNYFLVHMVDAPPYGTSRIYRRFPAGGDNSPTMPSVALNNGKNRQWRYAVNEPLTTKFSETNPAVFEMAGGEKTIQATALRTLTADLPHGDYLISVDVGNPAAKAHGMLAVTTSSKVMCQYGLGIGFSPAPYLPHESVVHMVTQHPGGPLYISQLDDNPAARLEVKSIRGIGDTGTGGKLTEGMSVKIPNFMEWTVQNTGVAIRLANDHQIDVWGDDTQYGYQVASPRINVPMNTKMLLELPMDNTAGTAHIGILDSKSMWLVPPREGSKIEFETGGSNNITIVAANNFPSTKTTKTVFSIKKGTLISFGSASGSGETGELYVDQLAACIKGRKRGDTSACANP